MLTGIDLTIICVYFVLLLSVGLFVAKKASGSLNDYFLAGKGIPWYILGLSGMATYIDMSGTTLQVSFFYMLGVKGYWVAYRGAIALILAFLMIFIAKWLNRSGVMTNAEWMEFRFGTGKQGRTARLLAASAMILTVIAFVGYFFVGTGKFLSAFVPALSPNVIAMIFFGIVFIYAVASGFYGVVYTDLLQGGLILGLILFVAIKAMAIGTPQYYETFATTEWRNLIPSSWEFDMPAGYENMRLLSLLVLFWIIANVFQGFATPLDSWTSQRYYAAKDERESSLVAAEWIVLFGFRFLLMMGAGILAISIVGKISEPEMAFNAVINHYMPAGLKGAVLVAVLAAGMSTLDSFVNASAAYFVKDIYHVHIKPDADRKHLVKVSYCTTAGIMIFGVLLGCNMPNINSIWAWICMGLFTGMLPPNILKWFWWRFNGMGYACGMASGILSAVIQTLLFPQSAEYTTFTVVILISTVGTIIGTFAGKPADMDVLVNFYKKTRPFGFWQPVRRLCETDLVADIRKENRRDVLLIAPACLWQVTMYWMMTALVAKKWNSFFGSFAVVAVLSFILYKYWYKNLRRTTPQQQS